MNSLSNSIVELCRDLPEGEVVSPRDFLHLDGRPAVDKAFSALTKEGHILRVSRGIYVLPISSRFGVRAPAAWAVVRSLAMKNDVLIVRHGAWAANAFGLTTQVPVREVFVTGGRPLTLQLGKRSVEIRQGSHEELSLGASVAGDAVRALAWMGKLHATKTVEKLKQRLTKHDWQILFSARSQLPKWMSEALESQGPD